MTKSNIEQEIISALRALGCDAPEIVPAHDLAIDLGIDSTELIELAVIVRDGFGLRIKPDFRMIGTVEELVAEVARLATCEPLSV